MRDLLARKAVCFLALLFTSAVLSDAHALTAPELQRALQSSSRPTVRFEEVRESPWLSVPMTSRGTMQSTPQSLDKKVESPRQETWRLLADRIEWIGPGGEKKQTAFSQAPALGALADVMRRAVAGDITGLERDFRVQLRGDEKVWSAQLQPRNPEIARHLESVELQGTRGLLQVVIVTERQGERTVTRFQP